MNSPLLDFNTGILVDSTAGNVLDDIAEVVLRNGGQVVIVPAEQIPARIGLATIYRL